METGHCDCKAGLDECCSHIAAVLFALLTFVMVQSETTCTSLPNAWYGTQSGKAEMSEVSNISFANPKKQVDHIMETGSLLQTKTIKTRFIPAPTAQEISDFHQKIHALGMKCAVLSVVPGYAANFQPKVLKLNLPNSIMGLYNEEYLELTKPALASMASSILSEITLTDEQV